MAGIKSQPFYDLIYEAHKDYDAESERLRGMLEVACPGVGTLLDVACGTGQHLARLRTHYQVEGLDLDPEMLRIARAQLGPDVPLHRGDMRGFDLGKRFDAVTCLFGAVGYVRTPSALRRAVATMAGHLETGGVLVLEPWLLPGDARLDAIHSLSVEGSDLKLVRMGVSTVAGRLSTLDFHYLVANREGIQHFRETHRLGLFTDSEYREAFHRAGLRVEYDPEGLMGRGVYLGFPTA